MHLNESEPVCPECGSPLTATFEMDEKTKNIKVLLQCEGDGDDRFWFEIDTGLTNKKLAQLVKKGATVPMTGKLLERLKDPYPE